MILSEANALVLDAAVAMAVANNTNPTLQQVVDQYNLLAKTIDRTPEPRPVADPSTYTANAVGG